MRLLQPILSFALLCLLTIAVSVPVASAADPVKVTFQARIMEGAPPLKGDVQWAITPLDASGTPKQTLTKAAPELSLLPGRYRATATLGYVTASRDMTISAAGKQDIVLNGGFMRLAMIPDRKGKPINDPVRWQVYLYSKDGVDDKRKVTELTDPSPQLVLPVGYYVVRSKYQGIDAEMVAEVKLGILYKYTVVAYAGKIQLSAVDNKGRPVKSNIQWSVERAPKDATAKRTPVFTDSTANPQLLLGEGKYIVVARSGNLMGETPIEVKQFDLKAIKVQLKPQGGA
ncbi:MAG TPA: hypothetical protein VMQ73_18520 [Methylomirabilota bacterium]|nr:hypothetical protein [Methylomirabilota bacterium]